MRTDEAERIYRSFMLLRQHLPIDASKRFAFELQQNSCLTRSRAPRLNRRRKSSSCASTIITAAMSRLAWSGSCAGILKPEFVGYLCRRPAKVEADHRQSGGHRLDRSAATGIMKPRMQRDIAFAKPAKHLVPRHLPQKPDPLGNSQRSMPAARGAADPDRHRSASTLHPAILARAKARRLMSQPFQWASPPTLRNRIIVFRLAPGLTELAQTRRRATRSAKRSRRSCCQARAAAPSSLR